MQYKPHNAGRDPDIVFINCVRRPSEIIFKDRMEHMASRITGIELTWVVEATDRYRQWTGFKGHFNQLILGLAAPDYLEREVFCCGPEPFMQAGREALAGLGFDTERYHQESFEAPLADTGDVPEDVTLDDDARAQVEFARSGLSTECAETETLLNAARAAGLVIPLGCTFGVCGTCKVKKLEGRVHMAHNGGITDEDIKDGYVLACCSNPVGKVKMDS